MVNYQFSGRNGTPIQVERSDSHKNHESYDYFTILSQLLPSMKNIHLQRKMVYFCDSILTSY